jgi:hypothetical protein
MAVSIDLYLPAATDHYEVGVANVQNINVHFYFANVVHVVIFFTDGSIKNYYQVPAVLNTPSP